MSCRRNAAQIPARIPLCIFCKPGLAQTVSQAYPGCVHEGSLINILGATLNNINFPWFRHNPSLQPNPSMASVPWGGKGKVISFGTQKHAKALIGFFFSPLLSFYLLQILPKFYFSPQILYPEAKQEKRLPARRTHHAESGWVFLQLTEGTWGNALIYSWSQSCLPLVRFCSQQTHRPHIYTVCYISYLAYSSQVVLIRIMRNQIQNSVYPYNSSSISSETSYQRANKWIKRVVMLSSGTQRMVVAKLHWTEAYTIIYDHTNCPGFETQEGRARKGNNKNIYERRWGCSKLNTMPWNTRLGFRPSLVPYAKANLSCQDCK